MKKLLNKLSSSSLSPKAQSSGIQTFLGRIGLSVLAFPLAGALVGLLIDQLWPGPIPWVVALALIGLALGWVYLWSWMKQPNS